MQREELTVGEEQAPALLVNVSVCGNMSVHAEQSAILHLLRRAVDRKNLRLHEPNPRSSARFVNSVWLPSS